DSSTAAGRDRWVALAAKMGANLKKHKQGTGMKKGPAGPLCSRVRRCLGGRLAAFIDEQRFGRAENDVLVDDHLADIVLRGNVVHGVQQDAFEDGAQAARAGL